MFQMLDRRRVLVFVMDPIESVDIDADTTFVLMLEAQRRGHEVLYADPEGLSVKGGQAAAVVAPVRLRRERGDHFEKGASRAVVLDREVDAVFQRTDPPVDSDYVVATQILTLCERTLVLNRPQGLLAYNEKLGALLFPDLVPETIVTRRIEDLREFLARQGGRMIVKPLDGKGGEGVFQVLEDDPNTSSLLEQVTGFGARWAMAQQYIAEVATGDKRILLLDGELLGAVLRVPPAGEIRANLHVGARPSKTEITEADRRIIERLAPFLRREGLYFVGVDVIGGYLTEVNVTSPTGVQEVNALERSCLEARVIDWVEDRLRERDERSGRSERE
jgi:glutathione synthase